LTEDKNLSYY